MTIRLKIIEERMLGVQPTIRAKTNPAEMQIQQAIKKNAERMGLQKKTIKVKVPVKRLQELERKGICPQAFFDTQLNRLKNIMR